MNRQKFEQNVAHKILLKNRNFDEQNEGLS
jgi:hypothetical protein